MLVMTAMELKGVPKGMYAVMKHVLCSATLVLRTATNTVLITTALNVMPIISRHMYVMGVTTGVTATMTDISMMPRLQTGNLLKQESSQGKEFISQMRNFLE